MPKCTNCGADVPADKNFCPQCGSPVSQAGASGVPQQPPAGVPPQAPPGVTPQPPAGVTPPPPPGPPGGITPPPMLPPGPQAKPKKGMPRGAKIALILAVSAIVLIILAVALSVVFFANVITAPADVANNYVKAVNVRDLSTAWSYLTTRTQNQEGRLGFDTKLSPLKGTIRKWFTTSVNVETGGVSKIVMSLTFTDGTKTSWDMTLTKVGGKWKIDQVAPRE